MNPFRLGLLLLFLVLVTACSEKEGELTRVDVQILFENGVYQDTGMVLGQEQLEVVKDSFDNVKWEPNTKAEMATMAEYIATLFITEDENMPERLLEYKLWFNENGTATLISTEKSEGYGTLAKEHAQSLKKVLTQ